MTSRTVLTPGPDHPITIERNPRRVQVRAGDTISVLGHPPDALRAKIADTASALTLREAGYPSVQYIPRGDADMAQLRRSAHASYCPYKGEAAYFDIVAMGEKGKNAVWTYEQPYAAVAEIADHLAFYPSIVSVTEAAEEAA
jgi:uncharacterized protein (DUF427 family)